MLWVLFIQTGNQICKFVLLQKTQERQNKSRWELIKEKLNGKFTTSVELKASVTAMQF